MASGRPDWSGTSQQTGIAGVSDLGEVASRLGALSRLDRRGVVIWQDGYESGLSAWRVSLDMFASGYVMASGRLAYDGSLSACFYAVNAGEYNSMFRVVPYSAAYRQLGIECMVRLGLADECARFAPIMLDIFDGVQVRSLGVGYAWDGAQYQLQLWTNLGWVNIAALAEPFGTEWMLTKLVFDITTSYRRLVCQDREYDVSTHAFNVGAASTRKYLMLYPYILGGNHPGKCYLDNYIITRNEP